MVSAKSVREFLRHGANCVKQTASYCEQSIKATVFKGMLKFHMLYFNCDDDLSALLLDFDHVISIFNS